MTIRAFFVQSVFSVIILYSCGKDELPEEGFFSDDKSAPTPFYLPIPPGFPDYDLDEHNLLTREGVALGRRLFYDPILSKNRNTSCASCHRQEFAFADPDRFSLGTHKARTNFHSMPLFNIGWMDQFFWDGRAHTRKEQALQPVVNPVEMDLTWDEAINRLKADPVYSSMFLRAFGTTNIDSTMVVAALVQFEITIVSSESKYDRVNRGEAEFTDLEKRGLELFESNQGGDCFHCHMTSNVQIADNSFHNTGLDTDDEMHDGLMAVTGNSLDRGKFKTPSLRNLSFTAPYMHDGRFETIDDVLEFYSTGVKKNSNIDPLMEKAQFGGVNLANNDRDAIKAFLLTLNDSSILTDTSLANPFE